jgi:uncharacterized protein
VGRVAALSRYPVKSMAGERLDSVDVAADGVVGDRRWALRWRGERVLTARVAPRLLAWSARTTGDDRATLTDPVGDAWSVTDADLEAALRADLGKDATLIEDPAGIHDLRGSVLVTFESTRARLAQELGSDVDLRRFRPNIHVDSDEPPGSEAGWRGRRLAVGNVELELLHPCARCVMITRDPETQAAWPGLLRHIHDRHASIFGINARAVTRGEVRVGDAVALI